MFFLDTRVVMKIQVVIIPIWDIKVVLIIQPEIIMYFRVTVQDIQIQPLHGMFL